MIKTNLHTPKRYCLHRVLINLKDKSLTRLSGSTIIGRLIAAIKTEFDSHINLMAGARPLHSRLRKLKALSVLGLRELKRTRKRELRVKMSSLKRDVLDIAITLDSLISTGLIMS
jgi:hypothetical protein